MSKLKDFHIKNGVLTRYAGKGRNVVIPDSVTSIGDGAFYWCQNLTSIAIPDSVTSIGNSAFIGCTSLTSITIPDSVTSIGYSAFRACTSLTSITIPDSVTDIGAAAFGACPALAEEDGFVIIRNILYGYAGNATEVFIPDNVTAIDCDAFRNCMYIVSITIPDSVTSIGDGAFYWCQNLTSIAIPDSVTSIGSSTFSGCTSLTSIVIPDSVTSIGYSAFSGCSSLASITIPDSVTNINNYAFSNCRNLKSITFSNNLKEIGKGAFENCVNLRDWNFNEEITTFEGTALEVVFDYFFSSEMKLFLLEEFLFKYLDIVINNTSVNKKVKANKKKLLDLAVKNDNADLVEKLFNLYKKIPLDELNEYIDKAMTAPTLKAYLLAYKTRYYSVDDQEKHETEKLEKEFGIKERTLGDWKKIYNFETNGDTATITGYKGSDIDIVIPEKIGKYNVIAIAESAFCPSVQRLKEEQKLARKRIKNIVIPNGVKRIENHAFSECESLETISISDSVTYIGEKAFNYCKKLETIHIDFSNVEIGNDAFFACDALTDENGLFFNGDRLFCVRSDIKDYSIPNGVVVLDDNTIFFKYPINLNLDIHKMGYKQLATYCRTAKVIKLPSDLTEIRDAEDYRGLCSYNDNLKEIKLPESITKIGSIAFYKCESLTEIHLREGITYIGNHAFAGSGLKTVTIPSTVECIHYKAFADCSNLRVVNINEGVKTIEARAFERCTALTEIYIPASVTEILDNALPSNKNMIIYTPAGSYAEQYAKENNRKVKQEKEESDNNTIPFEYKISKDKTVKITAYISDNPNLVIPSQIAGCKVVNFNKGIFRNNKLITSVVWSAEIPVIPSEFFFGCSFIEKVVLSEGVTEISEKAFRNCFDLTSIYIPASVTSIHKNAFECVKIKYGVFEYWTCIKTIHAPAGSYAEQFAKENNINFIAEE